MSKVIDLNATLQRRERFIIALARELEEMFGNADAADPEPFQPTIEEIVSLLNSASDEDLEFDWRCAAAAFVTMGNSQRDPTASTVVDISADPMVWHRSCLAWSRVSLQKIEDDFGIPLLPRASAKASSVWPGPNDGDAA